MKGTICLLLIGLSMVTFTATSQVKPRSAKAARNKIARNKKIAKIQYGTASFYHNKFNGRRTASGSIFSQKKLTAAHNSVAFGTWLRVTNLRNKKSVIVQVNDRLHYRNKRIVDLSKAAANKLFFRSGLLPVKVEILGKLKPVAKAAW